GPEPAQHAEEEDPVRPGVVRVLERVAEAVSFVRLKRHFPIESRELAEERELRLLAEVEPGERARAPVEDPRGVLLHLVRGGDRRHEVPGRDERPRAVLRGAARRGLAPERRNFVAQTISLLEKTTERRHLERD